MTFRQLDLNCKNIIMLLAWKPQEKLWCKTVLRKISVDHGVSTTVKKMHTTYNIHVRHTVLTRVLISGYDSSQKSQLIILHLHVVVTCTSRFFLFIFTEQLLFKQGTSFRGQDSRWSYRNKRLEWDNYTYSFIKCNYKLNAVIVN